MTAGFGLEFLIRFWGHVDVRSDQDCWLWDAYCDEKGYGRITLPDRSVTRTHRIAYMLHHEKSDLGGLHVLHTCDVPKCCNPFHLFLGTNADNVADKVAKDRQARLRGELAGTSKLTDAIVTAMRVERLTGASIRSLAEKYGTEKSNASDILHGRSWSHLFGTDGHPSYADLVSVPDAPSGGQVLTDEAVATIMRRLGDGEAGKVIARDYGVHFQTISDIKNGRSWQHLAGTNGLPTIEQMQNAKPQSKTVAKLDAKAALEIKLMLAANVPVKAIADKFSVTIGAVYHIKQGKTWGEVTLP